MRRQPIFFALGVTRACGRVQQRLHVEENRNFAEAHWTRRQTCVLSYPDNLPRDVSLTVRGEGGEERGLHLFFPSQRATKDARIKLSKVKFGICSGHDCCSGTLRLLWILSWFLVSSGFPRRLVLGLCVRLWVLLRIC